MNEILSVPEEHLAEVIWIIRFGTTSYPGTTPEVREALTQWCDEMESYLTMPTDDDVD